MRALLIGLLLAAAAVVAAPDRPPVKIPTPAVLPPEAPATVPVAPWAQVKLAPVADGFERPVYATEQAGVVYVVEQIGRIWALKDGKRTLFLDIGKKLGSTRGEQGLLGLAFHPRFAENGLFFVGYTDQGDDDAYARAQVKNGVVDPASWTVLLSIDDPAGNHNGGHLAFGDDGALWLGTGDGGAANNIFKTAQDPGSLLGKMLRVDENGKAVPGNAYDGRPQGKPEIWGLGLRNPWRYAFDRATGDLWIADVGQNRWEEVHVVEKAARRPGLNFGWSRMEGKECFDARPCTASGTHVPVFVYGREDGCSITGGYVYRGAALPALVGTYVAGDYCSGKIFGVKKTKDGWMSTELLDTEHAISSFGEDERGELFLVDHNGAVLMFAPRP